MIRMPSSFRMPRIVSKSGLAARWPLAIFLIAASALGGILSGLNMAGSYLDAHERNRHANDRQIALVEDVSSLADLDARSDGAWDRYSTEINDMAIVKGGLTRNYRVPGPFVFMKEGEASYAVTRDIDAGLCVTPARALKEGPLAERIEVAVADKIDGIPGQWRPITGPEAPCSRPAAGAVLFRIAP